MASRRAAELSSHAAALASRAAALQSGLQTAGGSSSTHEMQPPTAVQPAACVHTRYLYNSPPVAILGVAAGGNRTKGGRRGGGRTHPLYFTPLLCAVGHTFDATAWTLTRQGAPPRRERLVLQGIIMAEIEAVHVTAPATLVAVTLSARTQPAHGRHDVLAARLLAVAGSREEPKGRRYRKVLLFATMESSIVANRCALPDESGGDAAETSDPIAATAMLRRSLKSWRTRGILSPLHWHRTRRLLLVQSSLPTISKRRSMRSVIQVWQGQAQKTSICAFAVIARKHEALLHCLTTWKDQYTATYLTAARACRRKSRAHARDARQGAARESPNLAGRREAIEDALLRRGGTLGGRVQQLLRGLTRTVEGMGRAPRARSPAASGSSPRCQSSRSSARWASHCTGGEDGVVQPIMFY